MAEPVVLHHSVAEDFWLPARSGHGAARLVYDDMHSANTVAVITDLNEWQALVRLSRSLSGSPQLLEVSDQFLRLHDLLRERGLLRRAKARSWVRHAIRISSLVGIDLSDAMPAAVALSLDYEVIHSNPSLDNPLDRLQSSEPGFRYRSLV